MLQQTQVDRVVAKYEEFVRRFPDPGSLAAAELRDILSVWQGLGYNRRALLLKKTAETLVTEHASALPQDPQHLVKLPGIGPASARSIAVYAFNRPEVFIETNVRAVFIHHFFAGRTGVRDSEILPLVEQTLDRKYPRGWYSALMDYGSVLKKAHPNPSRRSAHHAIQSPFEGSDRQVRGRVVKALLDKGPTGPAQLTKVTGVTAARLREVLPSLLKDGMVRRVGRKYCLA
jgi:A/G-specific adenine glycosylase